MGTFGTGILENDEAMDVYHSFMDEYFIGTDLEVIKSNIVQKFLLVDNTNTPIIQGNTNGWFAFSLACWECQALDETLFNVIKKISSEEIDSDHWEEKWEERKQVIGRLIRKLSKPAEKLKPIPKFITAHVPMKIGECFTFSYHDGKYGGAICLDIIVDGKKTVRYVYGVTRLRMDITPSISDFLNSHFLVYNYGKTTDGESANWIKTPEVQIKYAFTGKLKIEEDKEWIEEIIKELKSNQSIGFVKVIKPVDKLYNGGNMSFDFSSNHENQFQWEDQNPNAIDLSYPIASFCELIND
jgi:hypothetical protein